MFCIYGAGKILPPPKILPVGFEALRVRGNASRRSEIFLAWVRRDGGQTVLINFRVLDAVAGGCPHPSASHKHSRTRNKISKKPADPGWRRMSPAPKRGEWGAGDVGAPSARCHKLNFSGYCFKISSSSV